MSTRGGVLTLLDSEIVGARGIFAQNGAYVDIDCISEGSGDPCSRTNFIDSMGVLIVAPGVEGAGSQLRGTTIVLGFGRALIRAATTLDGTIQCQSAGDAWLDAAVIKNPGSSVTGCEHPSYP